MTRKDKILVAFFGLTALAGFGSGVHHLAHHARHHHHRRAAFERHVADVCVEAARRADGEATISRRGGATPPRHARQPARSE
ncbi:MAG: hypothetical protein AAF447_20565 [Myxococcota bacterium]